MKRLYVVMYGVLAIILLCPCVSGAASPLSQECPSGQDLFVSESGIHSVLGQIDVSGGNDLWSFIGNGQTITIEIVALRDLPNNQLAPYVTLYEGGACAQNLLRQPNNANPNAARWALYNYVLPVGQQTYNIRVEGLSNSVGEYVLRVHGLSPNTIRSEFGPQDWAIGARVSSESFSSLSHYNHPYTVRNHPNERTLLGSIAPSNDLIIMGGPHQYDGDFWWLVMNEASNAWGWLPEKPQTNGENPEGQNPEIENPTSECIQGSSLPVDENGVYGILGYVDVPGQINRYAFVGDGQTITIEIIALLDGVNDFVPSYELFAGGDCPQNAIRGHTASSDTIGRLYAFSVDLPAGRQAYTISIKDMAFNSTGGYVLRIHGLAPGQYTGEFGPREWAMDDIVSAQEFNDLTLYTHPNDIPNHPNERLSVGTLSPDDSVRIIGGPVMTWDHGYMWLVRAEDDHAKGWLPEHAAGAANSGGSSAVSDVEISFWADTDQVYQGECTTIHWDVENANAVYYFGEGVVGHDAVLECPAESTTYYLDVTDLNGNAYTREVTISVDNTLNLGTGDVQATLSWSNAADMDLHIIGPDGTEMYYGHKHEPSTGAELDVDANAGCGDAAANPVENVYWPSGSAPRGTYTVWAAEWSDCSASPGTWTLVVRVDGRVVINQSGSGSSQQYTFTR